MVSWKSNFLHTKGFEEHGCLVDHGLVIYSFLDGKAKYSNHGQTAVLDFSQLNTLFAFLVLGVDAQRVESKIYLK